MYESIAEQLMNLDSTQLANYFTEVFTTYRNAFIVAIGIIILMYGLGIGNSKIASLFLVSFLAFAMSKVLPITVVYPVYLLLLFVIFFGGKKKGGRR